MKRTFACIGAAALLTMCALTSVNTFTAKAVFITAFVVLFISLIIKKTRSHAALPVIAATVCVCCVVFAFYGFSVEKKTCALDDRGKTHHLICQIISLPVADNGRVYYTVKTEEIDGKPNVQKMRLSFKEYLNAEPFDRLEGDFHTYKLGAFSSETETYYCSKGLFLGGYTDKTENLIITGKIGFHPRYYVLKAKQFVIDTVSLCVPNEYGGLLTGFLLGEKGRVSEKTLNAFSLIGSYHLLAVSGLHITVWTGFVYSFLRALKLKRKLCNSLPILFILFFMALTGFNPPVVRAGVLMFFVFAGRLSDREADSINSIGFAVTLLVVFNPFSALSKSLWLSVFAALGIILVSGRIYAVMNKKELKNRLLEFIKTFSLQSFAVSLSVTVFTLPLTVLFFDRFSLVTPIANLVLIEITSFAMLLSGFAVLLFALKLAFAAYPLFFASSFLAKVISDFAAFLSKLPYITLSTDFLPLKIFALLTPFFVFSVYFLKKRNKERLIKIVSTAIAVSFVFISVFGVLTERKRVRIYIPAVGDGMSVALVYGNSASLIGCGGNFFAYSSVCDIMKKEGVAKLDFLFAPTNDRFVYSFFDELRNGFDIDMIKECEYGLVKLDDGVSVECRVDFAYISCKGVTALILFNPDYNAALLPEEYSSADYLFVRGSEPVNYKKDGFSSVIVVTDKKGDSSDLIYAGDEIMYLEAEQNGRARLETAN